MSSVKWQSPSPVRGSITTFYGHFRTNSAFILFFRNKNFPHFRFDNQFGKICFCMNSNASIFTCSFVSLISFEISQSSSKSFLNSNVFLH